MPAAETDSIIGVKLRNGRAKVRRVRMTQQIRPEIPNTRQALVVENLFQVVIVL